jgi:hypothetical protein
MVFIGECDQVSRQIEEEPVIRDVEQDDRCVRDV